MEEYVIGPFLDKEIQLQVIESTTAANRQEIKNSVGDGFGKIWFEQEGCISYSYIIFREYLNNFHIS